MWYSYQNLSMISGVSEYRYDERYYSWIEVQFVDDSSYLYTADSAGYNTILIMIDKAIKGVGLNRFINAEKPDYADKTR